MTVGITVLLCMIMLTTVSSFTPSIGTPLSRSCLLSNKNDDDNPKSFQEKLDQFLDKPIFDPDAVLEKDYENELNSNAAKDGTCDENESKNSQNPLALWFANLVKNDYETAEALYAASFISVMVVLTQELLRMVKYGDAYVPFVNGSASGGMLF